MDSTIIEIVNLTCNKRDLLFVLGDVAWTQESLKKLGAIKCRMILIAGNHDQFKTELYLKYFEQVQGVRQYKEFLLSHVPIHPQEMVYRHKTNVHGHIHDLNKDIGGSYINVNIDVMGITPISLDHLREIKRGRDGTP